MKKLYKKLSIVVASLGLLLQLSTASASVISFDYTDTVTVGDNFTVNVFADLGVNDLFSFGFDLSSLTNNVSFVSGTIHSAFVEDPFNDVGGVLDNFFDVVNGSVQLASLTFSADAVGSDTISLFGDSNNFDGLLFWDALNDVDIDASFDITVKDVSAPATLGLFAIAGLALFGFRRKA